jgi:hypothetical protein
MGKQNEKLLDNMKELDKQKLPKWFTGECYTQGAEVTNRFGGDSCYLNNIELSMYDFIMGATMVVEMRGDYKSLMDASMITDLRKGLDWFRKNNPSAYMVLLD